MKLKFRSLTLGAGVLMIAACARQEAPPAQPAHPTLLESIATTRQLMLGLTIPASDVLFQVGSAAPTDDAGWEKVQANAAMLAESGNLLLTGSRAIDAPEWKGFAQSLITSSKAALQRRRRAMWTRCWTSATRSTRSATAATRNTWPLGPGVSSDMSTPVSPFEVNPPSGQKLLKSIAAAIAGAALILVLVVLPAEFAIDPTGVGKALGLTEMHAPTRTLQIKRRHRRQREISRGEDLDSHDPTPLPNPAVAQIKAAAPKVETKTLTLEPGQQTEIKAILDEAQVVVYSWKAEGGQVYTDFHGHEPNAGEAFVRYEEQQSGDGRARRHFVAPFSGEHGWF